VAGRSAGEDAGSASNRSGTLDRGEHAAGKRRTALDTFVTISTPWGGHRATELGVEYAPAVVPAWLDMQPGNAFLKGILQPNLPPECRYYLFFSYGGGSSLIRGANDGVVTLTSELAPQPKSKRSRCTAFLKAT
jgi:hypothetical protein